MAKGALKLGTGAINFFKEGEGIAKIGASISSIGGNISNFLEEGKSAFKALGEIGANKLDNFLKSVKDVKNNIGKTLEEIKIKIQSIGDVTKGSAEAINLWKKSTCSIDKLYKYLKNIDSDAAEVLLNEGKWPSEIQIPKNSSALRPDGTINWDKAQKGGYVLNSVGEADKTPFTPLKGEIIDRYGPSNGRYTSPVIDGNPYNYDQRALPYLEDPAQYHQYEVVGDMSKLEEYVANCPDATVKYKIEGDIEQYYNGDYSKVITYKGDIAGIDGWGSGGGIQYEFPITVENLEKLGILKEIK